MSPLRKINHKFVLNYKDLIVHWTDSYHQKQIYKESAKMHHQLMPYINLHQHQSCAQQHHATQPGVGSITSPALLPKGDLLALTFQDCCKTIQWLFLLSLPRETSLPYLKSLSSAFLFPASLTHSAVGPSCPPCHTLVLNTTAE